jgi:hypothetical protein
MLSLAGSFCIQLIIGTAYISGDVGVYFASYLRIDDSSVTLDQLGTILNIQIGVSTLFVAIGTASARLRSLAL